MRSSELSCLFGGLDNAFKVYANNVVEKLGTHIDICSSADLLTFNLFAVAIHSVFF